MHSNPGPELTPQLLGARILEALKATNTSRERAADTIGKSRDTLDRYIKGNQNPSAIDVWKISQLTGIDFAWFAVTDELDRRHVKINPTEEP